jgi:hypothetical protein
MKRFPQLTVVLAWLLAAGGTFGAGMAATAGLGELTHSGLSSCGPYGPACNLLLCMIIATFPLSIVAGFWATWRADKYLKRGDKV